MFRSPLVALLLVLTSTHSLAQTFEEAAPPPSADEVRKILSGNVFSVSIADGSTWRVDFNKNGYYFFNASGGYSDSGKWRTEDGKLCVEPRKTPAACNDARVNQGFLVLKRLTGEIVVYRPKE